MPETEIPAHKFPFCPSASRIDHTAWGRRMGRIVQTGMGRICSGANSPDTVGRDVNDVTAGGRYG
jgi:hypothetical protein